MHGYSRTPLARKLGIKERHSLLLHTAPDHYFELFSDFPEKVVIVNAAPEKETVDVIHAFCLSAQILENEILDLIPHLKKEGMLWVSWPKGTSSITTNLNREAVRDFLLNNSLLVDIKVAAIDADWSGLKFVYRKEHR